jgi:hypothetical protein
MSETLVSNPVALSQILEMLSQPDTETVKQGEKILKPFLKQSTCILALINQIRSSTKEAIRHHASLLLKKKASTLFNKFTAPQKQELKSQLLLLMTSEPSKSIGVALAGVVASVAKCVLTEGNWPELFALLMQLSQDPSESLRTLNFSLLEQVIRFNVRLQIESIKIKFMVNSQRNQTS